MTVLRRRPGAASVAALSGLVLTVAAAHAVAPDWSRRAGLDVWNLAELEGVQAEQEARRQQLAEIEDRLGWSVTASDHIAARLADGEVGLAAATAELLRVNEGRDGFAVALRFTHPEVPSHRARVARYAIDKVARRLANDPARRAAVLARLEAEYAAMPGPK